MRRKTLLIRHEVCLDQVRLQQTGPGLLPMAAFPRAYQGENQECFNSTTRGCTMPAFTFEKIAPPQHRAPLPPIKKKQRGFIGQVLDRFAAARAKRGLREERHGLSRRQRNSPD